MYILSSKRNGTLYVGVTSDLVTRIYQQREHLVGGFTSKYKVDRLVWFGECGSILEAIELEKKIKNKLGIGLPGSADDESFLKTMPT